MKNPARGSAVVVEYNLFEIVDLLPLTTFLEVSQKEYFKFSSLLILFLD